MGMIVTASAGAAGEYVNGDRFIARCGNPRISPSGPSTADAARAAQDGPTAHREQQPEQGDNESGQYQHGGRLYQRRPGQSPCLRPRLARDEHVGDAGGEPKEQDEGKYAGHRDDDVAEQRSLLTAAARTGSSRPPDSSACNRRSAWSA